jgi:hypothetical protein
MVTAKRTPKRRPAPRKSTKATTKKPRKAATPKAMTRSPRKAAKAKVTTRTPRKAPQRLLSRGALAARGFVGLNDIVLFTSPDGNTVVGPGRVCTELGFGQFCVMFGDGIGCRRVDGARLSLAPSGSTAPPCGDCVDC